ncbi:MAG: hypothetical protein IJ880_04500 [Bacilli bacterium]|nr:hypothetical protein [Bacilli bacterium]
MQELFGLKNKLTKRYKDDKNNYCLEIGSKENLMKFSNAIYNDATIYLDRKYKRYLRLKAQSLASAMV